MADGSLIAVGRQQPGDAAWVWISALFALQLVLAITIIPPWQNPDEPRHVSMVRILSRGTVLNAARGADPQTEREVLESMAEFDWWRYYGRPTPVPLPARFIDVPSVESPVVGGPSAYYHAASWVIAASRFDGVLEQVYVLRGVSAALGFFTLWSVFFATRLLVGWPGAVGVATLLALHPQFAIASTTAGPAALVNLLAALVWWQGARLLATRHRAVPFVLMWSAAGAAFFVSRLGLTLAVAALLLSAMAMLHGIRYDRRAAIWIAGGLLACAAVASAVAYLAWPSVVTIVDYAISDFRRPDALSWGDWEYLGRFSRFLFDSSWLVAGWVQFPAPRAALNAVLVVVAIAGLGLIPALRRPGAGPYRRGVLAAGLLLLVQVAAIYAVYFRIHRGPHGRHLMPVAGPALLLLWEGFLAWWPMSTRAIGGALLVILGAAFDLIGWLMVLVPAYVD